MAPGDLPLRVDRQAASDRAGYFSYLLAMFLIGSLAIETTVQIFRQFRTCGRFSPVDGAVLMAACAFASALFRMRNLRARLLLVFFAFLLGMAGMEAAIYFFSLRLPREVWPSGLDVTLRPEGTLPGITGPSRVTAHPPGVRGQKWPTPATLRLLAIGGSATECLYLDDTETWPALLAVELTARRGDRVWVGNVGRAGLNTADHVALVRHFPPAREVDGWIVLCGVNDLLQNLSGSYRIYKRNARTRSFVHPMLGDTPARTRRPLYRNLLSWRALEHAFNPDRAVGIRQDATGEWVREQQRLRRAAKRVDILPDLAPFLAEYRLQLHSLLDEAQVRRKPVALCTQPVLWRDNLSTREEEMLCMGRRDETAYYSAAALARGMDAFHAVTRAVAADRGALLVDLAAEIEASSDFFYDDCHFTEAGARRVAAVIARVLFEHGWPMRQTGNNLSAQP